jgi:hypothetical protein
MDKLMDPRYDPECDLCKFNYMSDAELKRFKRYWKGEKGLSDAMREYEKDLNA